MVKFFPNKANPSLISSAISQFSWHEPLTRISIPSLRVALLNETILNITSNFVPNKIIRIKPSEPEWLHRKITNMLKKQNRSYKKYKNNGFWEEAVEKSKQNYLSNSVPCKVPRILPLIIAVKFVTSCKEKAVLFNNILLLNINHFEIHVCTAKILLSN